LHLVLAFYRVGIWLPFVEAEFLATVLVLVYVGAVMQVMVFIRIR
jgi:NADH:ubiquinone oxidoreductase subunit 6 (subunit J)